MAKFITIDARAMTSIDYSAYLADYYAAQGSTAGATTYYGSQNFPGFGYYDGTQVGVRFSGSTDQAQILMQGADMQYDGVIGQHGSYSGSVNAVTFGHYDDGTTYTEDGSTRSELTGVLKELVIRGLDVLAEPGAGMGADNAFYQLMLALRNGNHATNGATYIDALYDLFASKAQFFRGSAGSDTYVGTEFNDKIVGGKGFDTLDGAGGKDTFVFKMGDSAASAHRADIIENFVKGDDILNFHSIDANENKKGNQDFTFIGKNDFSGKAGELMYQKEKDFTYVYVDTDGDGWQDMTVRLDGSHKLSASDFIL